MADESGKNTRRNFIYKVITFSIAVAVMFFLDANSAANIVIMLWPTTEGEVVELRHSNSPQDVLERQMNVLQFQQTTVIYQYQVAGHVYKTAGLRTKRQWWRHWIVPYFGQFSIIKSDLSQTVDPKYPVGKKIVVHYDPSNPEKACLEIHFLQSFGL